MAERQQWKVTEPYLHIKCALGEAPFYEESTHSLRFVDIMKKKFYTIDLNEGPASLKTLDVADAVSITADVANTKDNTIMVGAKYGFAKLDRSTGRIDYLKKVWEGTSDAGRADKMRFNDGAVDSRGRFWAGAMSDPMVKEITNEGVLFRLDPDLSLHRMIEPVAVPNGIGWSMDDRTMFFVDSFTGKIEKFDYDIETGGISNRRAHFTLENESGGPDGWAMDVNGCIWSAIYGAGKILKISPEGKVVGEILLPAKNPTCPRFVGEDLFITSAAEENPDETGKYGGSLFRVHVGVKGVPLHKFRL